MATITDHGPGFSGKRWTVRYREPGGRTARQREKSFDRKKDATDFAIKVENDKRENVYVDPTAGKVPLHRYAAEWLNAKSMSAGTTESCERIMRLHVIPYLGRKSLSQVTTADIEELYARWRRAGAAPNTIETRHIAVSGLFSHAVRHKRTIKSPVQQAERPHSPVIRVDERSLPEYEEIAALARGIGPRLEPSIWLMACCGLRIGESLGIFPEDIHGGTLRLRRQVVRIKGGTGKYMAPYAPLKHRKEGEWRNVPVPRFVESLVSAFRSQMRPEGCPTRSSSGNPGAAPLSDVA
ncbi:tyrosine-type recombinase/integrase [Saccharothrix sp. ST-888]|uniref:tyrosine-type recombinase/integrase n=1 Tax=Saccharothrix sp. ST-888 TaxID=1427391 RepID=UPI000B0AE755|nr:hypothetical protein [Saccharothrix sp. ST-888]